MERRKAMIAAATASLTLLAGAAAVSINSSIVGASGDHGVGEVQPVETTVQGDDTATHDPSAGPGDRTSATVTTRSLGSDDREDDGEDEPSHDQSGVGDEHEYEGAEDDD